MENTQTMKKTDHNLAIVFDDLTEFFVMQPAINAMEKTNIKVDIIVPYDSGYNHLAEYTFKKIKSLGYSPLKDAPNNVRYKILLTPYPGLDIVKRLNYVYHIRYPYGAFSAKPNPTYLPECKIDYDAIFSFNKYETFLNAYGPIIYPLPYWRYHNFKRQATNNKKPTLLLLPTFGTDVSFIKHFTTKTMEDIKQHFHIIAKAHHAVHFGIDGEESLEILENLSDEFYDSSVAIDTLLSKANVVLSDNSGAIFEAICAGVPIAIFTDDPNARHLNKLNTMQYELVQEKVIPQAKKPNEILPILLNIKKYAKKQAETKEKLFICDYKNPYKDFLDIINHYLEIDENTDKRKILHDILLEKLSEQELRIKKLEQEIIKKDEISANLTKHIEAIYNSTSWKITKPLRIIKTKGQSNAK